MGFFEKLKNGMNKTKSSFDEKINNVFKSFRKVDEDFLEELEEILIMSDIGVDTSVKIINNLRTKIKKEKIQDEEDVKKIIENAKRMERPVSIATAEEIVANGSDKDLEDYFAIAHHRVNVSEKFEEYVEKDVFQIMLGCDLEERKYILEGTKNAKVAAWWSRAIDIIPKDGGKGTAIEQVLAHYKFSKEEAIAFGDGENDIDMLLSVGKGIAMGNAAEKVKEIAADICESVTDDGIYYYLKSQKLINE